jgi:hypothetical protein
MGSGAILRAGGEHTDCDRSDSLTRSKVGFAGRGSRLDKGVAERCMLAR